MRHPYNVISFVVDEAPLFQVQAWLLLHNLSKHINPDDTQIILNYCGTIDPLLRRKAHEAGGNICEVARYGEGPAAYCNKLQQFDNVMASGAQYVVMCDSDIGFMVDPCTLVRADMVQAKPVDLCNPPSEMLSHIFDLAGFPNARFDTQPEFQAEELRDRTHRFNCNGGLYILPVEMLRRMAPVWRRYAELCLTQQEVLGRAAVHCDQISFALALEELALPFNPLEARHNFPLHFAKSSYAHHGHLRPEVLHYHRKMGPHGTILGPDVPNIRAQVDRFNTLMADARASSDFQTLLTRANMGPRT